METLKEKIVKEYLEAFKSRDAVKKNLLGVVKAEITTQEKNTTVENLSDEDVSKILKKISKGLNETISKADREEAKNEAIAELTVIDSYLPKQMSEVEIRAEVASVIVEISASGASDMGKVMTGFNSKFSGKADNKLVSTIVRELLK